MTLVTFYDTASRQKKPFRPLDPANIRLYVCGPTVYDQAHIGNARPVVVFDTVVRLLRRLYPHVTYVRNITDVDDKIIDAADRQGVPIAEITSRTTRVFHEDMAALNALPPDFEPRATDYIAGMIAMIETLIGKGHAYEADGHVLFDTASMEDYGKFARRSADELIAGARVEVAPYKRNPMDFVLWKPSSEAQPGWNSPWGRGRPGWHIECSAMSEALLGVTFDIHGGGIDLVFPHHQNEIAQSTCAHGGATQANYWMHNGHVTVGGEKMSKSLGNFFTVRDLLREFPGEAIRLALLRTHYRRPLDFTRERVAEAKLTLDRLYRALDSLKDVPAEPVNQKVKALTAPSSIEDELCDDLNTPNAIALLQGVADYVLNPERLDTLVDAATGEALGITLGQAKSYLLQSANLLGLLQQDPEAWFRGEGQGDLDTDAIDLKVAARVAARQAKDFAEADRIRDELVSAGIILEDGPDGTVWRKRR